MYMNIKWCMMPNESLIPVVFYKTASGSAPARDWMRDLAREDRRQVGLDLLRIQELWPVGMPLCRSLGSGLWEVRSSLYGGRIARVMFCMQQGSIYVLHGFIKKTRKTPPQDMALARRRMKEIVR